jgi:hypothetical protein
MVSNDAPWLANLFGGLPVDFDYGVIRSAGDARSLILTLPSHDRGTAAHGLHDHRRLVGYDAAYCGIMTAWDHDERDTIDAFGSADQFIAALKDVAPPRPLRTQLKRIAAWRGVIVGKADCLRSSRGLGAFHLFFGAASSFAETRQSVFPARPIRHRAAGPSAPITSSSITTRSTRADTLRPGSSRNSNRSGPQRPPCSSTSRA